jgi:hypothetical protein
MIDRDDEFEAMLAPLKNAQPNDLQMQSWHNTIRSELKKKLVTVERSKYFAHIVAAVAVGLLLGVVVFRATRLQTAEDVVARTFSESNATFEHTHTNLD